MPLSSDTNQIQPHASKEFFTKEGILQCVLHYKNDVLHTTDGQFCQFFNPLGELILEQSYCNGELDGPTHTYQHGFLYTKTIFQKGVKNGLEEMYFPTGVVMISRNYKDGLLDGFEKRFDEFSNLLQENFYQNGVLQGESSSYYASGALFEKKAYKNNLQTAESVTYHQNGILASYGIYDKGVLVEPKTLYNAKGKELK
ncbi:MAG TPA: hypothetical protein VI959_02535 [Alphaproteobacteria bacterium]|nr:hypothetical protein [Alphaproteobacteria bacterium]